MIPKKLRLKNFTGIRSGLGRDEIVIDFEALAGDAQLVALVGPNGTGKSTILDNMHPFRVMPSRAGSYSPASFSFYDNIYGGEAVKEFEFHHGNLYLRSILVFKMGAKTKKTECYLQYMDDIGDAEWHPYRMPDGTVSDGKTETYDRCVEHILGTPEMFFTSAFAAQNRKSLSSYTNGEIKGLLSELLGLDHIRELGAKATDVARLLRGRYEGMKNDVARIDGLDTERATVEMMLDTDKDALNITMQARHAAKGRVEAANKTLANTKAKLGAGAEVEERRKSLQAQRNGVDMRVGGTLRQIDADIQSEKQRAAQTTTAIRQEIGRLEGQIRSHEQQIKSNQILLASKAKIEGAVLELKQLEADEAAAQKTVVRLKAAASQYRILLAERGQLTEQLKAAGQHGEAIAKTCEGLKTRSNLIDQVPCQGTDLQPRCPLLKDAHAARESIPATEQQITESRAKYDDIRKRGQEINAALELMGDTEDDLKAAEDVKQAIVTKMRAAAALAGQATALAQAEQAIQHAQEQLASIRASVAAKTAEVTRVETDTAARVADLMVRRATTETEATAERNTINKELAALPPPADGSAVEAAERALQAAEQDAAALDQDYEQLNIRIATHKERLRSIENDLRNGAAVRATAQTIETEIAHWTALAKALGTDGIIALSIDDAGPTLASLANDLLLSCYGPRFSVSLRTQEQKASGDMKETFDIRVFDAERDDDKSVRDMSGGERIWINECITRAIALYQAQASGQQYGTLFADESDGALDPERKQMFVAMKRKVLELGGYEREYFISHALAVQEMADAIIDISTFRQGT